MNHFAGYPYGDLRLRAGARFKADVSTYWDVDQCLVRPPLEWFRSSNEVILCNGVVDPRLIDKVINNASGFTIYQRPVEWRDGHLGHAR